MTSSTVSSTSSATIESALPRVEMLMENGWKSHELHGHTHTISL